MKPAMGLSTVLSVGQKIENVKKMKKNILKSLKSNKNLHHLSV